MTNYIELDPWFSNFLNENLIIVLTLENIELANNAIKNAAIKLLNT